MKICIDLSPAIHQRGGIGQYANELCKALIKLNEGIQYIGFCNSNAHPTLQSIPSIKIISAHMPNKFWRLSVLLSQLQHLSQDRLFSDCDLFHATDHVLPFLTRTPSVFTLHDLTYLTVPHTHTYLNRFFLKTVMSRFLAQAREIIVPSESTKTATMHHYQVDPIKISVVKHGVNPIFHPRSNQEIAAIKQKYNIPAHYFLLVGTLEPRKNLGTLFKALGLIAGKANPKLVMVGEKGWRTRSIYQQARHYNQEDAVLWLGYIPTEHLPAIYSGADLLISPSLDEGFGLPVLEAMACGTLVVCSNITSHIEITGQHAMLFDPADPVQLAACLDQATCSPALREQIRLGALAKAQYYCWEETARQTLQIYHRVLEEV